MNDSPFETFRQTIDSLPAEAVLKAALVERFMLEEDLAGGQMPPSENTNSILAFCRFLAGAPYGSMDWPQTIPMEHWMFYVKTVGRLVAAEKLPCSVKKDIEAAFHGVSCCIMA